MRDVGSLMRGGWLSLGRLRGMPIRVHWSAPLGAWFWCGSGFAPALWLAFLGSVLVHELGHALLVRRARARVLGVSLHAMGGECRWQGHVTPMQRACIAWGGVWAESLLLIAAWLVEQAGVGEAIGGEAPAVLALLVRANAGMIVFNLLPIRPLDGAEAWRIVPLLIHRARGLFLRRKYGRLHRRLRVLRGGRRDLD